MSVLSDHIENFIKELMGESGTTDLQRNELASYFNCAPSQINYVLTTRFSPKRGYIIKSRRGGGGYIRVIRLDSDRTDFILELLESELSNEINMRQAVELVESLYQIGFIGEVCRNVLMAAVSDKALALAGENKNALRAAVLKEMLLQVI